MKIQTLNFPSFHETYWKKIKGYRIPKTLFSVNKEELIDDIGASFQKVCICLGLKRNKKRISKLTPLPEKFAIRTNLTLQILTFYLLKQELEMTFCK